MSVKNNFNSSDVFTYVGEYAFILMNNLLYRYWRTKKKKKFILIINKLKKKLKKNVDYTFGKINLTNEKISIINYTVYNIRIVVCF